MGDRLIEHVLDHAPADLTPAERMVLVVVARHADRRTRECWPSIDTIAEQAGLKPESVSKTLQRLARRTPSLELRVPVGTDRIGRPVFAHKGRKTTYRLPLLTAQRADGGPAIEEGQRADQDPGFDSKDGQQSGLTAPKGGPQSPKGRTTVRQRADGGPPLTVNEQSENQLPKDSSSAPPVRDEAADDLFGPLAASSKAASESKAAEDLKPFGDFWLLYPKKKDREEALKEWRAAVARGADPAHITEAARRYAKERAGQDPKYTKFPATWLRKGCYDDEPDPEVGRANLRAVSGDGWRPFQNPENHDVYDEGLI